LPCQARHHQPAVSHSAAPAQELEQQQQQMLLAYAGVGIVTGSEAKSEWQELALKAREAIVVQTLLHEDPKHRTKHPENPQHTSKHPLTSSDVVQVRQFEGLLSPLLTPALASLPNAAMAWAALAIEELMRCGVNTFAVAPGVCVSVLVSVACVSPISTPSCCCLCATHVPKLT
jgi:hypothetical protein